MPGPAASCYTRRATRIVSAYKARGGNWTMMDAIQRMRRERRLAFFIFALFFVVALVVHLFVSAPSAHAPSTVPAEVRE